LIHESDPLAPEQGAGRFGQLGDLAAGHCDRATVGAVDAAYQVQEGRLSRAAAAENRYGLPTADLRVRAVENAVNAAALMEVAAKLTNGEQICGAATPGIRLQGAPTLPRDRGSCRALESPGKKGSRPIADRRNCRPAAVSAVIHGP
jgi:hypothetical protein